MTAQGRIDEGEEANLVRVRKSLSKLEACRSVGDTAAALPDDLDQ